MKKKKTKKQSGGGVAFLAVLLAAALLGGGAFAVYQWRFAPSKVRMALTDYFVLSGAEDCAVILDGEYLAQEDGDGTSASLARVNGDHLYLALSFVKDALDDGYVYDAQAAQLRYCTDAALIIAEAGETGWLEGETRLSADAPAVLSDGDTAWLLSDFVETYTDVASELHRDAPARAVLETAGTAKTVATVTHEEAVRRYGGIKSDVLTTAEAGAEVTVLEDYGDWAKVLTPDAVIGCLRTSRLENRREVTAAARLEPRVYTHNLLPETVVAGWHQVLSSAANGNVTNLLDGTNVNVVIPTWFLMNDDAGGIVSFADSAYVQTCHSRGVQVWGLLSNIEYDIDTTSVLNSSAARDALVDRLMGEASSCGLDGINVDIESLQAAAGDGYIQLIRELSLRCAEAGLVLSVDNYVPTSYTTVYNRAEQAKYADYHIIMGYDEHWGGGEEGSVSSYGFVRDGVEAVLETTDASQIILGLPFYTRVWTTDDGGNTTSQTLIIAEENRFLSSAGLTWDDAEWLQDEQQYFVEYDSAGGTSRIWLEEQDSLSAKISVARDFDLGGICFWRLGQEPKNMWSTIEAAVGP